MPRRPGPSPQPGDWALVSPLLYRQEATKSPTPWGNREQDPVWREKQVGEKSQSRERETGSQRGDCPSPGLGVGRGKGKLFPSSPLGPLVGESVGTGSRSSGPPKVAERDLGQKPRSAEAGTERVTRPLGALWVWGSHSDRAWLPAGSSEAPFSEASPELQSLNPPQTQSLWVGESHLPTSQSGKLRHDEASEAPGVLGAES